MDASLWFPVPLVRLDAPDYVGTRLTVLPLPQVAGRSAVCQISAAADREVQRLSASITSGFASRWR